MSYAAALQTAIFARLDAELSVQVVAYHEQVADAARDDKFPVVLIGDDSFTQNNSDDRRGFSATVTVHTFTRERGYAEVKLIQGQIYDALDRFALSVLGYGVTMIDQEYSEATREADNLTVHGVQRFRVLLREAV